MFVVGPYICGPLSNHAAHDWPPWINRRFDLADSNFLAHTQSFFFVEVAAGFGRR